MEKRTKEWLAQSDYDVDTASYMFKGGRYIYAVFMCHLSIEKALKGLYYEKIREVPPKTHSLIHLLYAVGISPPENHGRFVVKLNEASIPTRYPENLVQQIKIYNETVVYDILLKTQELIQWIKNQF
ncbi:MAG: HEPN domain-containing protein [Desulfobacteraceae bacterium]|nr:HEPN domain-containing protein [Desulfobacteraceae bacterium]